MTPECEVCGEQKPEGASEYNPLALLVVNPVDNLGGNNPGWYSGDDGELCGDCMLTIFRRANKIAL